MLLHLLGHRILDFESNGEQVKGTQVFVSYAADGVVGQITDKIFFKAGFDLPELTPGMTLDVTFNRRGRPEKVVAAPATQRLTLNK